MDSCLCKICICFGKWIFTKACTAWKWGSTFAPLQIAQLFGKLGVQSIFSLHAKQGQIFNVSQLCCSYSRDFGTVRLQLHTRRRTATVCLCFPRLHTVSLALSIHFLRAGSGNILPVFHANFHQCNVTRSVLSTEVFWIFLHLLYIVWKLISKILRSRSIVKNSISLYFLAKIFHKCCPWIYLLGGV